MENPDVSNYSSSPHRLPTLSASQALQNLSSVHQKPISTGLRRLDAFLQGREVDEDPSSGGGGGLSPGQVTEIYGPPGIGKTTFAMQISARALQAGCSVTWIDASYELVGPRLREIISGPKVDESENPRSSSDDLLERFHQLNTPTLPHLLTLLIHSPESFPPKGTGLIVIDSVSTLFAAAFPKVNDFHENKQTPGKKTSDTPQWAASRKWAVIGEFVSKLSKLAATKNIAILLTCQTITKIRAETGAMLHPSISATAWDSGISSRISLFKDWLHEPNENSSQAEYGIGQRFAGVIKANGVLHEGLGQIVSFTIKKHGLEEVPVDSSNLKMSYQSPGPHRPHKRPYTEIADRQSGEEFGSEDEFGWAGDDDPSLEGVVKR